MNVMKQTGPKGPESPVGGKILWAVAGYVAGALTVGLIVLIVWAMGPREEPMSRAPMSSASASTQASIEETVTWKDKAEQYRNEYGSLDTPPWNKNTGVEFVKTYFGWNEKTTKTNFLNRVRPMVNDDVFAQLKEMPGPYEWQDQRGKVAKRSIEIIDTPDWLVSEDEPNEGSVVFEVHDELADGSRTSTTMRLFIRTEMMWFPRQDEDLGYREIAERRVTEVGDPEVVSAS